MTAAQQPDPRVDGSDEADPVDPDEIAEQAPIDPTPQEVDEYRSLIGDEPPGQETGVEEMGEELPERGGRKPVIPEF